MQDFGGLESKMKVAKFKFDFVKDGGAVGDIVIGAGKLPAGAIISRGTLHVDKAVTSDGSATVALTVESAGDVLAATAKTSLTLNAMLNIVPVGTAATQVKTTVARGITVSVAVAALTAGAFTLFIEYYVL